jgi:hypothetical protein
MNIRKILKKENAMKTIKNVLYFGVLIIGFFSCKTPVYNIIGTYLPISDNRTKHLKGLKIYTANKFVLNADSTFNYSYIVIGNEEKYSSGTWRRIDKNAIVLNSYIQSNVIPLNIEVVNSNNKKPMINVKLIIPGKDEKEYRCTPYYAVIEGKWYEPNTLFVPDRGSHSYEESNYYSNEHELFFKVSKEPRQIEFVGPRLFKEYYVLETEHKKITTKDGDIVNVTVIVPDSLFSYRIFNNEKIKLRKNKLIFRDNERNNKTSKLILNN